MTSTETAADTDAGTETDPGTAFLMQAFDPANRADPYPLYAEMRAKQPILDGGIGLWFLFTHKAAHGLLRSRTTSSDERLSNEFKANVEHDERYQRFAELEPLMLFTDPPDHTRLRGLVSRAFTPRTVQQMRPRLEQLAASLVEQLAGDTPIDLVEALAYPFPVTVICELLGIPEGDAAFFRSMSDDLTLSVEPGALRTPDQEVAIDKAREDIGEYITELLKHRRESPGDDLISGLLAARDGDDRLSESELINMVILLLLAGHETTVNLIGNSAVSLLRNPDQLQIWRDNPDQALAYVDELTRFDSPVQMAMRVVLDDTEIEGSVLPAGDQVICLLGSANRDADVFADADSLDLLRPNAAVNLSFGGGIHHCLGMALARTEAAIVLDTLVRRFPKIELAAEPTVRDRFVLRGYERIMVSAGS